jgi:hypothetical protein
MDATEDDVSRRLIAFQKPPDVAWRLTVTP